MSEQAHRVRIETWDDDLAISGAMTAREQTP
jgi:hypothetical protein